MFSDMMTTEKTDAQKPAEKRPGEVRAGLKRPCRIRTGGKRADRGIARLGTVLVIVLLAVLLAVAMVAVMMLGVFKPTEVSVTRTAIEKVKKAQSARIRTKIDMDGEIEYVPLNFAVDIGLNFDIDMEAVRDPLVTKGTMDAGIELFGSSQTVGTEFYTKDSEEEGKVTYARLAGGIWTKKTEKKAAKENGSEKEEGEKTTEEKETGEEKSEDKKTGEKKGSSGLSANPLGAGIMIVKAISEKKLTAQLKEETVEIEGKEASQIDCVMDGVFLKEMITAGNVNTKTLPFDFEKVEWDNVKIPMTIYVYKESNLPARIYIDGSSLGREALSKVIEDALDDAPVKGIQARINTCLIDITFSDYDEIGEIEIPQEVLSAKEAEDMLSQIFDSIGLK